MAERFQLPPTASSGNNTPDNDGFAGFLAAALTGVLLMALIAMALLIVNRGVAHFWLQPVHFLVLQNGDQQDLDYRFARLEHHTIQGSQPRVWLHQGKHGKPVNSKPSVLLREQIAYADTPANVAKIRLRDGAYVLAIPRVIQVAQERRDISAYPQIAAAVRAAYVAYTATQTEQLAPVQQRLWELRTNKVAVTAPAYQDAMAEFQKWRASAEQQQAQLQQFQLIVGLADGTTSAIPMVEIAAVYFPNQASPLLKLQYLGAQIWEFVTGFPQQGMTAGGVFPALFGTVLMVLLMTLMVTPLGVIAAIYLTEYSSNNLVVAAVRVAVGNLAGVPAIVYGVFGLGFFVYTLGGEIDNWLYADSETAVFGAPGLLWASLVMALLTLPVVIVATEEGLRRVPFSLRQGSYALGATKYETVRLVVLPLATPGIMTGVILAIARGAGEVAPLLMLGAVRFALLLPVDGQAPYIHLERQFMHLGVLIYDGAFHSQQAGGEASLMFAACLLLLLVVLVLNTMAVQVRNRLRRQYRDLIGK